MINGAHVMLYTPEAEAVGHADPTAEGPSTGPLPVGVAGAG